MSTLEARLEGEFERLHVSDTNRDSVRSYLGILKQKHEGTYEHSVRVGLLGIKVGEHLQLTDPKALFFAGCLHDVGKAMVDSKILKKTEGFNEEDMQVMRSHPEHSYRLLKGVHQYSAEIALRHHRFQRNGYPQQVPSLSEPFSAGSEVMLNLYARLLAIIDFYDAATTRSNNKFGEEKAPPKTPEETKRLLIEANPDQKILIENLYRAGIFGDGQEPEPEKLASDDPMDRLTDGLKKMLG